MLSRVADSLYWMSRYLERAEHTARLMDVNFNLMLEESSPSSGRRWERMLRALGNPPDLVWNGDSTELTQRLAFDTSITCSIVGCIAAARENARQVREQISSEQWQRLNVLYHAVTQSEFSDLRSVQATDFLQAVMEGVHLLQGVTESVMLQGEGWEFIRTGRYLERAFSTATLLGVYSTDFWEQSGKHPEGHEYLEWIGLLRSCTAFEGYCKVYTADIMPERILEFLLLYSEFPHTVRFSIESVRDSVEAIQLQGGGRRSIPLDRVCGRLQAMLSYADLTEVLETGVGPFVREIVRHCHTIHELIYKRFIHYSVESALAG